jgi:hypothetical protein
VAGWVRRRPADRPPPGCGTREWDDRRRGVALADPDQRPYEDRRVARQDPGGFPVGARHAREEGRVGRRRAMDQRLECGLRRLHVDQATHADLPGQ